MEIKVNVPRPGLEPQEITINLPPRTKEEKNNLLSLSDKDLAQLDPEKLEQVRRAKENLIEIMKADREVQAMINQEQFEAMISQKMTETGLSQEEAELLVKHEQGLLGPNRPVFSPPAEDPITKAVKEIVAERIKETLTPKGDDGDKKGGGPDLAHTLKAAKEQGVNSIALLDGTILNISPKDTFGDELVRDALNYGKEKLQQVLRGEGGGGGGGLSPELLAVQDPAILKVLLDDKARGAELEATKIIAEAKSKATMQVAMLAAMALSPEVYAKVKGLVEMGKGALAGGGETPQDQPPQDQPPQDQPPPQDNFIGFACIKCNHANIVQIGTPKFTCEKCGAVNEQDW